MRNRMRNRARYTYVLHHHWPAADHIRPCSALTVPPRAPAGSAPDAGRGHRQAGSSSSQVSRQRRSPPVRPQQTASARAPAPVCSSAIACPARPAGRSTPCGRPPAAPHLRRVAAHARHARPHWSPGARRRTARMLRPLSGTTAAPALLRRTRYPAARRHAQEEQQRCYSRRSDARGSRLQPGGMLPARSPSPA